MFVRMVGVSVGVGKGGNKLYGGKVVGYYDGV